MTNYTKFTLTLFFCLSLSLTLATHHTVVLCTVDNASFNFESEGSEDETELTPSFFKHEENTDFSAKSNYAFPIKCIYQQKQAYWAHAPPANKA